MKPQPLLHYETIIIIMKPQPLLPTKLDVELKFTNERAAGYCSVNFQVQEI